MKKGLFNKVTKKYNPDPNIMIYHPEASAHLGKPHWMLICDVRIDVDGIDGVTHVIIKKGYLSDGITWPLKRRPIPYWGNSVKGVLAHDYLCEELKIYNGSELISISRHQADEIFYYVMMGEKVPYYERAVIYILVSAYRLIKRINGPSKSEIKSRYEQSIRDNWDYHYINFVKQWRDE